MKITRSYWQREGARLMRVNPSRLGVVPGNANEAHALFDRAKDRGEIVAPGACSRCASSEGRIFGHHEDYRRPLDVVWLCAQCHATRHVELRLADAEALGLVVREKRVREPGDPDLYGCTGCGSQAHNWRCCPMRTPDAWQVPRSFAVVEVRR